LAVADGIRCSTGHERVELVGADAARPPFDERRVDDQTPRFGASELDEREPCGRFREGVNQAKAFRYEVRFRGFRKKLGKAPGGVHEKGCRAPAEGSIRRSEKGGQGSDSRGTDALRGAVPSGVPGGLHAAPRGCAGAHPAPRALFEEWWVRQHDVGDAEKTPWKAGVRQICSVDVAAEVRQPEISLGKQGKLRVSLDEVDDSHGPKATVHEGERAHACAEVDDPARLRPAGGSERGEEQCIDVDAVASGRLPDAEAPAKQRIFGRTRNVGRN